MASNSSSIQDPDYNAYPDWIEIYNAEMSAVNLVDYFITDDPEDPQKYKIITDLVIPPQGYILIWADDMNTGSHANFQLSASGEFVGLYNPSVEVVDTITFTGQQNNVSSGRFPDGGSEWYRFYPSTPGTSNPEINRMLSEPEFSIKGGFYNSAVTLTLTHPDPGVTIAYTTNGTIPDTGSIIYAGPVSLTTNTAVTAIAFKDGFTKSKPVVNTYFLNFETELPVFSIVTDPANFFSDTSGIYVIGTNGIPGRCVTEPRNWNQEWQRPVNLEFYENNKQPAFNVTTGIQIYGGCTRIYAMKSLAFYFKDEYDYSRLN